MEIPSEFQFDSGITPQVGGVEIAAMGEDTEEGVLSRADGQDDHDSGLPYAEQGDIEVGDEIDEFQGRLAAAMEGIKDPRE